MIIDKDTTLQGNQEVEKVKHDVTFTVLDGEMKVNIVGKRAVLKTNFGAKKKFGNIIVHTVKSGCQLNSSAKIKFRDNFDIALIAYANEAISAFKVGSGSKLISGSSEIQARDIGNQCGLEANQAIQVCMVGDDCSFSTNRGPMNLYAAGNNFLANSYGQLTIKGPVGKSATMKSLVSGISVGTVGELSALAAVMDINICSNLCDSTAVKSMQGIVHIAGKVGDFAAIQANNDITILRSLGNNSAVLSLAKGVKVDGFVGENSSIQAELDVKIRGKLANGVTVLSVNGSALIKNDVGIVSIEAAKEIVIHGDIADGARINCTEGDVRIYGKVSANQLSNITAAGHVYVNDKLVTAQVSPLIMKDHKTTATERYNTNLTRIERLRAKINQHISFNSFFPAETQMNAARHNLHKSKWKLFGFLKPSKPSLRGCQQAEQNTFEPVRAKLLSCKR